MIKNVKFYGPGLGTFDALKKRIDKKKCKPIEISLTSYRDFLCNNFDEFINKGISLQLNCARGGSSYIIIGDYDQVDKDIQEEVDNWVSKTNSTNKYDGYILKTNGNLIIPEVKKRYEARVKLENMS